MEKNDKPEKKIDISYKAIIWLASIGIIAIVLANVAIAVYWGIAGLPDNNSGEATLLSTGIGIIGLAISVWAGLHIANLVSQKDIDRLKTDLENLSETTKYKIKPFIEQSRKTIFQQFLITIESIQEDPIAQVFVKQFREIPDSDKNIPYEKLIEIETLIAQVLLRHRSEYAYDEVLINLADTGLEIIRQIEGRSLAKEYLAYRKACFLFYKGYCDIDKVESAKDFDNAVNVVLTLSVNDPFSKDLENNKYALACLYNMIGESYSKIMVYFTDLMRKDRTQKEDEFVSAFKSHSEMAEVNAIHYCNKAIQLVPTSMYWRNLGCAHERVDRIHEINGEGEYKHSGDIILAYLKSVEQAMKESAVPNGTAQKAFQVLLMYYKAYINSEQLYIPNAQIDKKYEVHISNMYAYATIAKLDFPHCLRFYKLYAYSCYFVLCALNTGLNIDSASGKEPMYFKNQIKETKTLLESIDTEEGKNDFFTKDLEKILTII